MSSNVYSFNQALENKCEPREYPFQKEFLPTGTFIATLDFKIWSKKEIAVNCYFSQKESGKKFLVVVYRRPMPLGDYRLTGCELDFKQCPIHTEYEITIEPNGKGNLRFTDAHLI